MAKKSRFLKKRSHSEYLKMTTLDLAVIGTHIEKKFPGHGVFKGKVISADNGFYQVQYSDGDEEELSPVELAKLLPKSMSGTRSNSASKRSAAPGVSSEMAAGNKRAKIDISDGEEIEESPAKKLSLEQVRKELGHHLELPDDTFERAARSYGMEFSEVRDICTKAVADPENSTAIQALHELIQKIAPTGVVFHLENIPLVAWLMQWPNGSKSFTVCDGKGLFARVKGNEATLEYEKGTYAHNLTGAMAQIANTITDVPTSRVMSCNIIEQVQALVPTGDGGHEAILYGDIGNLESVINASLYKIVQIMVCIKSFATGAHARLFYEQAIFDEWKSKIVYGAHLEAVHNYTIRKNERFPSGTEMIMQAGAIMHKKVNGSSLYDPSEADETRTKVTEQKTVVRTRSKQ
jgi:hypothetical protein